MFIKTFQITLGILVAFSVWCYAIALVYMLICAASISLHQLAH